MAGILPSRIFLFRTFMPDELAMCREWTEGLMALGLEI
jgi:hypothetical protein